MSNEQARLSKLLGALSRDDLPSLSPTAATWLVGMFFIFLGQRVFADGALEWPLTIMGFISAIGPVAASIQRRAAEVDPGRRQALTTWVLGGSLGLFAVAMYFTTTSGFTDALGLDEDAAGRWYGVMTSIYLIVFALGAFPMLFADRVLANNPTVLPGSTAKRSMYSGLATGLMLCLLFPVNYLTSGLDLEYDYASFRTTRAGGSTLALVRNLPDPVHATLFFTSSNDVKEQVVPYMKSLEAAADGKFTWEVVDQAMVPSKAEELKVRDNGYIAFSQGENTEKFKVGTELDRAKRDLKKLDGTVQKHLLKLAKGQRTAYMLTGHGEASSREKDNPTRKLNLFKKLLQGQNYKVKDLGVSDGSADKIPDDAGLVVIAGPTKPLLPEEEVAMSEYLARGGRIMLLVDPIPNPGPGETGDAGANLLAMLGLQASSAPLAHKTKYVPQKRGKYDRILLHSNRYGSHASVKTLSRNNSRLHVIMPTVTGLEKIDEQPGKVTTLVRSHPDTWADTNTNFEKDTDETAKVWDLAVAVEGASDAGEGEKAWRAVVVGDVSFLADSVLQFSQGNAQFALDTTRWLVGDEDLAGEVENEEDVKIQHTREEDTYWFYGTVFLFPLLIMLAGVVTTRIRRRS